MSLCVCAYVSGRVGCCRYITVLHDHSSLCSSIHSKDFNNDALLYAVIDVTELMCCRIMMLMLGLGRGLFSVDPITGWSVTPVATASIANTEAVFNVSVTGGTNMTIEIIDEPSSDVLETQWATAVEDVSQISHAFTEAKRHALVFRISNDASQSNVNLTYDVDFAISGSSSTITATRPDEECVLYVSIETGSRTQFYVTWDEHLSTASSNDTYFATTHNFTEIGNYEVDVSIQNSVSMDNFTVTAYVRYEITALTLAQIDYSDAPALRNVTFLSTITEGSDVTVVKEFGDEYVTIDHFNDTSLLLSREFRHTYDSIGDYTLVVEYQNHVSRMSRNISFAVNIGITGFEVDAPGHAVINQNVSITLLVESGNPVHYVVAGTSGSGGTKTLLDSTPSLAGNLTAIDDTIFKTAFTALGDNTVRATASNVINGNTVDTVKIVHVDVYNKVTGLTASTDKGFNVKTNDEITFTVSAATGSLVTVVAVFGDGTAHVSQNHGKREAEQAPVEFVHAYSSVGNYTATFTSSNKVGVYKISLPELVIQDPVSGIRLSAQSPVAVPDGRVTYTVTVTDTPSNPFCHWTFADGTAKTVYATALTNGSANYQEGFSYDESMIGEQAVVVNCSNLASSGQASATVMVQRKVEGVNITLMTPAVAVSAPATVEVTALKGSHLQFTVDFGDGSPATVLPHSDQLDSTTAVAFEHEYTIPGNYTVHVNASNNVSSLYVAASQYVIVQTPIDGLALESDSPVRYPEYVNYQITTEQTSATEHLFMTWDFGDGTRQDAYIERLTADVPFKLTHDYVGNNLTLPLVTTVNCSNMVSYVLLTTTVVIETPISGVSLSTNTSAIPVSTAAQFVALAREGDGLRFTVDFGDGSSSYVTEGHVANETVRFKHTYLTVGSYAVHVNVENSISKERETLESNVVVQQPLHRGDIELRPNTTRRPTSVPGFKFTIAVATGKETPTDVNVSATFPDSDTHELFIGNKWPFTFEHIFVGIPAGNVTGTVTLRNMVSSETFNVTVQLQELISGLSVRAPPFAVKDEQVTIAVTLEAGSDIVGEVNFDDNKAEETIPGENINKTFNLTHAYDTAGKFHVAVTLKNYFDSITSFSNELIVQKRVDGFDLRGNDFVKIPDGNLTLAIERQEYERVPTPFNISVSYEDEAPSHAQSHFNSPVYLSHEFKKSGSFVVHVNVSNDVSVQSLSKYIEVHEAITGLALSSQLDGGDIITGSTTCIIFQTFVFLAAIESGTNVSFWWTFGDGHTQQTSHNSVTHAYTEVGEYDVTVNASNPVEPGVIALQHIQVLSPLGIDSFAYNDTVTVNSSAPFVVHLNGTRDEICVEFKFTSYTDIILLWVGTSQKLCGRASMFVLKDFQEISTERNDAQSVILIRAFQRVTIYKVQVTVLSSTNETLVTDGEVTVTERVKLCLKPNVTAKENGNSAANPIVTKRSEDLVVSNSNFEIIKYAVNGEGVPAAIAAELKWEMFEYDNATGKQTPATFDAYGIATPVTVIAIPKQTLPYGMYTFTMTVTLKGFSQCSDSDSIFLSVVSTPLDINIKFGAFRLVGYDTPIEMNAADVSRDPDAEGGTETGITYEWRCRKTNEEESSSAVELPGLFCHYSYNNIETIPFALYIYTYMKCLSNLTPFRYSLLVFCMSVGMLSSSTGYNWSEQLVVKKKEFNRFVISVLASWCWPLP